MPSTKSTNERFSKIEKRLKKLENEVLKKSKISKKQGKTSNDYKGLKGGIRLLFDNGFFRKPKELKEIFNELKRENYHYSNATLSKILARDFVKKLRILQRVSGGTNFKYVVRK